MLSRARIAAGLAPLVIAPAVPGAALAATTFTVPAGPIRPGQAVTFTATVPCAAPAVCTWTTGDGGGPHEGSAFTYAFAAAGTVPVTLAVDPDPGVAGDESSEAEDVAVVANRAPSGSIAVVPSVPVAGQRVDLAVTATDPDGDALTFSWDVDEDGVTDATGPAASFTQPFAGVRTVRVTVADGFGASTVVAQVVRVTAFPLAAFGAVPAAPLAGDTVTFTSTSQDPDGTIAPGDQQWDLDGDNVFGDAAGPVAQRTFPLPGVFTVGLRVRDSDGVASFAFRDVPVSPRPKPAATPAAAAAAPAPPAAAATRTPARAAVRRIRPFPVLTIAGRFTRRGVRFTRFTVKAPSAARAEITCSGRGCRFSRRTYRPGRIRALERRLLRPGTRVTVRVTRTGFVGKYTSIVVRRGRAPRRVDRCLRPGSRKPSACPAS